MPKQSYRAAIRQLESLRQVGQSAIILHLAEEGIRYYSRHLPLVEDRDYFYVRSRVEFEEILEDKVQGDVYAVTTLHRFLRLELPDISNELVENWERVIELPATIGDGEIIIWRKTDSG